MLALQYHEFGPPGVLVFEEVPEPHAGPGSVRIAVHAVSVNPYDWKLRSGLLAGMVQTRFPVIPGVDAAGVVNEVGDGVSDVSVGDEVFGLGTATCAQHAVLSIYAAKPAEVPFVEAAAMGLAVEAAARALDLLDLAAPATLLVDGAAGGVGSAMVQIAVARGLTVIGTASPARHEYLRGLGVVATTYGEGLAERVAALAPQGVSAAVDVVGHGSVPTLVKIVGDPSRVVTVADFTAASLGVKVAGAGPRAGYALAEAARLRQEGRFRTSLHAVLPFARAAQAHELSQQGHVQGKVVLTVPQA